MILRNLAFAQLLSDETHARLTLEEALEQTTSGYAAALQQLEDRELRAVDADARCLELQSRLYAAMEKVTGGVAREAEDRCEESGRQV